MKWNLKIIQGQHFRVTEKSLRLFMTPRNNNGFNSKGSEDMATEITKKNHRFWPPHCRLKPHSHGTPTIIRMSLIAAESRDHGLYFAADSVGLPSCQFLW